MEASSDIEGQRPADAAAPDYQSLSGLAVTALLLGLASPAALATPLLLIVPAAAVCLALLAQRTIRESAGTLAGAALARWGMALALVAATATVAHGPVRDVLYRRQVTALADQWFTLLAETKWHDAQGLLTAQGASSLRPRPSPPGDKPPPEAEAAAIALERLRSDPVSRCLAGKKTPLVVQMAPSGAAPTFDGGRATMAREFTVAAAGEPSAACRISLQCVRFPAYAAAGQPWRVDRWSLTGDKAPPTP